MINPTPKVQTAEYLTIQPILAAMKASNDQLPKNDLPVDTNGTIQQNAEAAAHPKLTIYNAHGIITSDKPNTILVHA